MSSTIYTLKNFIIVSFFFCITLPLLIMFFTSSSFILSSLSLIATNSVDNSILYLDYINNELQYNIVHNNGNDTLLMRLISKDNSTKTYHTLLDNNFNQTSIWEEVQNDIIGSDIIVSINGKDLTKILFCLGNKNITLRFENPLTTNYLQGSASLIPVNIAGFEIENFNLQGKLNEASFNQLRLIPNPVLQQEERVLISSPPSYPVSKSLQDCLVYLCNDVYGMAQPHQALEGTCIDNGKTLNILAFAGTNNINLPTFTTDVFNDIKSITDNYKNAYDITTISPEARNKTKSYDILTGHSLGGAIGLYAIQNNLLKTKAIITFGSPLTTYTNNLIPITQFINTKEESTVCCSYGFLSCSVYGVLVIDPISQVLVGTHNNVVYVNKGTVVNPKYQNCKASLAYTVWDTQLNLHIPLINNYY